METRLLGILTKRQGIAILTVLVRNELDNRRVIVRRRGPPRQGFGRHVTANGTLADVDTRGNGKERIRNAIVKAHVTDLAIAAKCPTGNESGSERPRFVRKERAICVVHQSTFLRFAFYVNHSLREWKTDTFVCLKL